MVSDDERTCPYCGSTDPHAEMRPTEDTVVDVTCKTVYILPADDSDGFGFDHETFERIIDFYESEVGGGE